MMRPVPQRADLLALRRTVDENARLRLTELTAAAVTDLVAALAGGRPGDNLLQLASGAGGNPLYLTELVAALKRSATLTVVAGTARLTDGPAPGSLPAAIADRLGFVSGPVREVLRAAALLGAEFTVPDLAVVAGRSVPDLVPAIEEARAAGVLAESGDGLGFRHPLIRAALYDGMTVPVRAAWHREAGRALADAGAPVDRVARQLLWAVAGPSDAAQPVDEWTLSWLAGTAELLVSQAPGVAAELLRRAVAPAPAGSARHDSLTRHDFLMSRLADALYRVGDTAGAERVASQALPHAAEPDVIVDLHWTLAQCWMWDGRFAESIAALNRALAAPGISARHQARLLVLLARTHSKLGEAEKAGQVAAHGLRVAAETGDNWAMGWALHVLTIVTAVQGQMTTALSLFDKALTVTQGDPALTDLRLLLQINKAVALGNLDRYEEALTAAQQAMHLADQVGTMVRLYEAHSAIGQLLFETGRWDDAMAEVTALPAEMKEPVGICCDLGIAGVICFHRGEIAAARRHVAAAAPHAERVGNRVIGPLALARSLDREQAGALTDALAMLTAGFGDGTEELDELEKLLADAVRLAVQTGDLSTAKALAGHAAALGDGSEVPHRQANALYCHGLVDHDRAQLLAAAARYGDAGQPLLRAKALEAAAANSSGVDRGQPLAQAVEIYTRLGAAADVARLRPPVGQGT
jgi:tetratricopeptide (TPR) repeat protein